MSDLISKEKLKDDIAVLLEENNYLIDEWLANCIDDVIDEQPTIEAEPTDRINLQELEDRFGKYVRFVVEDMISGEGKRWEK